MTLSPPGASAQFSLEAKGGQQVVTTPPLMSSLPAHRMRMEIVPVRTVSGLRTESMKSRCDSAKGLPNVW